MSDDDDSQSSDDTSSDGDCLTTSRKFLSQLRKTSEWCDRLSRLRFLAGQNQSSDGENDASSEASEENSNEEDGASSKEASDTSEDESNASTAEGSELDSSGSAESTVGKEDEEQLEKSSSEEEVRSEPESIESEATSYESNPDYLANTDEADEVGLDLAEKRMAVDVRRHRLAYNISRSGTISRKYQRSKARNKRDDADARKLWYSKDERLERKAQRIRIRSRQRRRRQARSRIYSKAKREKLKQVQRLAEAEGREPPRKLKKSERPPRPKRKELGVSSDDDVPNTSDECKGPTKSFMENVKEEERKPKSEFELPLLWDPNDPNNPYSSDE